MPDEFKSTMICKTILLACFGTSREFKLVLRLVILFFVAMIIYTIGNLENLPKKHISFYLIQCAHFKGKRETITKKRRKT